MKASTGLVPSSGGTLLIIARNIENAIVMILMGMRKGIKNCESIDVRRVCQCTENRIVLMCAVLLVMHYQRIVNDAVIRKGMT